MLAIFLESTFASGARACALFVSPSGFDSNDGKSAEQAFSTIQKAVDLAGPGDTIHLATGRYLQDVLSRRDGTETSPITITGPASAVVLGAGASHIIQINHSHIVLRGFTVDGLHGDPTVADGYRDKLLYVLGKGTRAGVEGLRIFNMTFKNAGGECVRLRYFARHNEIAFSTLLNCGVHDFVFNAGGKNGEAVYIGTAPEQLNDGKNPTPDPDVSRDNWVHHNTMVAGGNECVDIKESSIQNLIEHNHCSGQKDPESGGMDSRGNENIFRYNEIYGNLGAGVRLGGDSDSDGINNSVYLNTIHANQAGGIKFQRHPQQLICGNSMVNNTGGNAVGTHRSEYEPTQACDPLSGAVLDLN